MSLTPLRRLLPGAARRAGLTRDLAITSALRAARGALEATFGPSYGRMADAVAVRPDGALVIACRNPSVAQTLRLKERAVLAAVRAVPGAAPVTRLLLAPRSQSDLDAWLQETAPSSPGDPSAEDLGGTDGTSYA